MHAWKYDFDAIFPFFIDYFIRNVLDQWIDLKVSLDNTSLK